MATGTNEQCPTLPTRTGSKQAEQHQPGLVVRVRDPASAPQLEPAQAGQYYSVQGRGGQDLQRVGLGSVKWPHLTALGTVPRRLSMGGAQGPKPRRSLLTHSACVSVCLMHVHTPSPHGGTGYDATRTFLWNLG